MTLQSIDLCVNPADETIRLGPLVVRFLVTGENSSGTVAVFEVVVPAGQRLMAPAHSHDHYEETIYGIEGVLTWTVDGKPIDVGPGQALCIPRGAVHRFDNNGAEDVKVLCVGHARRNRPAVFPRSGRGGRARRPVVRRTGQRWWRSCAATGSLRLRLRLRRRADDLSRPAIARHKRTRAGSRRALCLCKIADALTGSKIES